MLCSFIYVHNFPVLNLNVHCVVIPGMRYTWLVYPYGFFDLKCEGAYDT